MARFHKLVLCTLLLTTTTYAEEALEISHGPMLGAVSENSAAIWLRTRVPGDVTITVSSSTPQPEQLLQKVKTTAESDNTYIARFNNLNPNTRYRYVALAGKSKYEGRFTTLGPSRKSTAVRMVYGYGYNHGQNKMKAGTSVFMEMASRRADLILFLGDFPYTSSGSRGGIRNGNKRIRDVVGFTQLTSSTPTYGIYDDHDFGPNDCDGTHKNADEALATFKEYWPNPSYGLPDSKGIHSSFVVGDVELFLLDGRYPARKREKTMLGESQFKWLCNGLKNSTARYKVLVSGTQFGRAKDDGWAGRYYIGERKRLFTFISRNSIAGVIGISGDVHRSDIYKLPIGDDRFFYDFTPGALARQQRTPPKPLPPAMIHSYGRGDDNNMFGEIEFRPSSDKETAIIFRSFSAKNGLIYEHTLSPLDLGIQKDAESGKGELLAPPPHTTTACGSAPGGSSKVSTSPPIIRKVD